MLEKLFKLTEHGTDVRTELLAGSDDLPDNGLYHLCKPDHAGYYGVWIKGGGVCCHLSGCDGRLFHYGLCRQLSCCSGSGHGLECVLYLWRCSWNGGIRGRLHWLRYSYLAYALLR